MLITICMWSAFVQAMEIQGHLDSFSTRHGLIHNQVSALYQEPGGFLWVGTSAGLCRFDGRRFDDMTLLENAPQGKVLDLLDDHQGGFWVVTQHQVFLWRNGNFRLCFTDKNERIRSYTVDREGQVWLNSGDTIWKVSPTERVNISEGEEKLNSRVGAIFQDREGRIWLGFRFGGAAVFHGEERGWEYFETREGIPHQTVNGFLQDKEGRLWVATHKGLAILRRGIFQPVSFNEQLPSPIVYSLFEARDGAVWMTLARGGVARWDGETLRLFRESDGLISDSISSIFQDSSGRIWFTSAKGLGGYWQDRLWTLKSEDGLSSNLVTCLLERENGLLWIGTRGGFNRLESSSFETFLQDPTSRRVPFWSQARSIIRDPEGSLWFPSLRGLGCYDQRGFRSYTMEDGLPSNEVHLLLTDRGGRVWAGTTGGIAFLNGNRFLVPAPADLLIHGVSIMVEDRDGRIWIADNNREIWSCEPDAERFTSIGQFDIILGIYPQEKGGVWLYGGDRLVEYRDGARKDVLIGDLLPEKELISRHFDGENWWFGTFQGLFRYDGQKVEQFPPFTTTEARAVVLIMPGKGDELWLSLAKQPTGSNLDFERTDLVRFDGKVATRWNEKRGLLTNKIQRVVLDSRENHWFFSEKGLTRLEEAGTRHLTIADGLSGNLPSDVAWDRAGNLWIATNGGINKWQDFANRQDRLLTKLSTADGLLDPEITDIEPDADEGLWIRSRNGVQRYRENPNGPRIELVGLYDGPQELPRLSGLVLAHHQNDLIFEVGGIHLRRGSEQIQFAYKLKGESESATTTGVTHEPTLHFPSLRPGAYHFEITAYNRDLYASEKPVLFSFRIQRPFWLSTWFLVMIAILALLIGYLINRIRLGKKLEQARIFNEIRTAHRMQMSLMPKSPPVLDRYEIHGLCEPAREVGGDFFDYFWLDDKMEHLGMAIMDVSGKSMEAAIISVMTSGLVYSEIGSCHSPGTILSKINYPMYKKTDKRIFTTGLIASLNLEMGRLSLANAGHMDPILIRGGRQLSPDTIAERDIPLGVKPRWNFVERLWQLEPGDVLLFYTDGLTEAADERERLFGEERVVSYLEGHDSAPLETLLKGLLGEVKRFSGEVPQRDDVTLIAIRVRTV